MRRISADARRIPTRISAYFDGSMRQVAHNSAWSVVTTALAAGLFFVETIVLARYLGRELFGVYVLVVAVPEAVQLVLDFRTREAMTRYLGGYLARDEKPEAVAIVKLLWFLDLVVVSLALALVVILAPFVAPALTDHPDGATLMQIYAIALVFRGLDATAGSILRVFDRFRLAFVLAVGSMVPRLLVVLALVYAGAGLEGIVWGRVAAEAWTTVIVGTAAFLLLKRTLWSHRATPVRVLRDVRREILAFLGHMNLQGSIRTAASKLDVIAVGALAGPSSASLYKIGVQFGSSPILIADPLFNATYPTFARLAALGDAPGMRAVGRRSSVILAMIATPIAAVLAFVSEPLLRGVVGEEYAEAWKPMVIVLVSMVPAVVFFWGRAAMLSRGDARIATSITGRAILVQFVLLVPLVHWLGATGAALTLASMHILAVLFTVRYLRSERLL